MCKGRRNRGNVSNSDVYIIYMYIYIYTELTIRGMSPPWWFNSIQSESRFPRFRNILLPYERATLTRSPSSTYTPTVIRYWIFLVFLVIFFIFHPSALILLTVRFISFQYIVPLFFIIIYPWDSTYRSRKSDEAYRQRRREQGSVSFFHNFFSVLIFPFPTFVLLYFTFFTNNFTEGNYYYYFFLSLEIEFDKGSTNASCENWSIRSEYLLYPVGSHPGLCPKINPIFFLTP